MIKKLAISAIFMVFTSQSHAETAEQLCTAGGYYSGAKDQFLSGLAAHILSQRDQLSSPGCGTLWKEASEVGERFSRTGKTKSTDERVISEAANFSKKVYDSIAKSSGL